jgi:hypothetical protein
MDAALTRTTPSPITRALPPSCATSSSVTSSSPSVQQHTQSPAVPPTSAVVSPPSSEVGDILFRAGAASSAAGSVRLRFVCQLLGFSYFFFGHRSCIFQCYSNHQAKADVWRLVPPRRSAHTHTHNTVSDALAERIDVSLHMTTAEESKVSTAGIDRGALQRLGSKFFLYSLSTHPPAASEKHPNRRRTLYTHSTLTAINNRLSSLSANRLFSRAQFTGGRRRTVRRARSTRWRGPRSPT